MTKTFFNATFAATLLAASVLGSTAAFADPATVSSGSYYHGVAPDQEQGQKIAAMRAQGIGTRVFTENMTNTRATRVGPANGDYYQGLDRTATSAR